LSHITKRKKQSGKFNDIIEAELFKTLKIKDETHKELVKLGGKNDSFDDIIMRLIKEHYEKKPTGK
jgi:putative antitoxin of VapBC-like toxin-antitoxin system